MSTKPVQIDRQVCQIISAEVGGVVCLLLLLFCSVLLLLLLFACFLPVCFCSFGGFGVCVCRGGGGCAFLQACGLEPRSRLL